MADRFTEFLGRNPAGVFTTIGLVSLAGVVFDAKWAEEKGRNALLDKISQSDVTKDVCPATAGPINLPLTLAPLMFVEDPMLHKTGEDLLRHATAHGVSFAFCSLAAGTTSFEAVPVKGGGYSNVLKINNGATAQEQQAAVMQFLKEYKSGSVSINYNNIVHANPELAKRMPGRLPADVDVKKFNLKQFDNTFGIPAR